ncbi:MAG: hypothetical protein JNK45_38155 [Myxococcales bacterium]|nr:hypothetical protein [Myxococcales bacterium]
MTRTRLAFLAAALVLGCGLFNGNRDRKAQRVAPKIARRVPPAARGPGLASIPEQARPTAELLGEGVLVGIRDAVSEVLDDPAAIEGEVAWLGPVLTRDREDDAHTLVVVRRAAFGVHVPSSGERHAVDDDVLDDRGLGVDFDVVALIGPERPCLTARQAPVVTAMQLGGHVLDVRWPLADCGPGPWAPVGLVAAGISRTLRWEAPACDEPEDIRAAWQSAGDPATTHLGVLRDGEAIVALIGEGTLWIAGPGGWTSRPFPLGGATARGCGEAAAAEATLTETDGLDPDAGATDGA